MTTFYTRKTGNDANPGTDAQPKLTIMAGIGLLADNSSDILLIGTGTYSENLSITGLTGTSAVSRIVIAAEPNATVTIATPSGGGIALFVDGIGNIEFRDLIFDGHFSAFTTCISATTGDIHHILWNHLEIKNTGRVSGGMNSSTQPDNTNGITGGGRDGEFRNCYIHDNGNGGFDHGLYGPGRPNTVIDGCNVSHNAGWGFHDFNDTPGDFFVTVKNSIFSENGQSGFLGAQQNGGGSGIGQYGSTTGALIFNNLCYGNFHQGIVCQYGEVGDEIYNNSVYNNSGIDGAVYLGAGHTGAVVRNNLVFGNANDAIVIIEGGTTSNNMFTDPEWVNPATGDFHLQATSDAIAAGVAVAEVTVDFDGNTRPNPPAVGAYEGPSGSEPSDPLAENFDSYSAAASIDTLNGGTGWTQAWDLTAGTITVENAPAWFSGKSLRINDTSASKTVRRLFGAKSGIFSVGFAISVSVIPNDYIIVALLDQLGMIQIRIGFTPGGTLDAEQTTLVGSIATDHEYAITVNFDTNAQPGKFRVSINGNTYSNWINTISSFSSIAGVEIIDTTTNAHTFWLDDINEGFPVTGPGVIMLGACLND